MCILIHEYGLDNIFTTCEQFILKNINIFVKGNITCCRRTSMVKY